MPKYETRLSGAAYELKRVFPGVWRWRVFPALGDAGGLAWGRRGAMRAARSYLRGLKPARPSPCGPLRTLPAVVEPTDADRRTETTPEA